VGGVCQAACPGTLTDCNGICTNTMVDPSNCGACGATCPQACLNGACFP
jgi:hypothetical protein